MVLVARWSSSIACDRTSRRKLSCDLNSFLFCFSSRRTCFLRQWRCSSLLLILNQVPITEVHYSNIVFCSLETLCHIGYSAPGSREKVFHLKPNSDESHRRGDIGTANKEVEIQKRVSKLDVATIPQCQTSSIMTVFSPGSMTPVLISPGESLRQRY